MKEATGEANITVITIILIAIVLAVGTVVINGVMNNTKRKTCCESLGGTLTGTSCKIGSTTYTTTTAGSYKECLAGN